MTKTNSALPEGVLKSDTEHPGYNKADSLDTTVGEYGTLHFYNTTGFGWCLATLGISNAKRGMAARTYAVRVSDGAQVRIGQGPHVVATVAVYVRCSRRAALQRYIDLYNAGSIKANTTRDRISSRRAQGQEERAAGHRYWRWNS